MQFKILRELKPNMIVARDIIDTNGYVLLRAGVTLTEYYIQRLKERNISGVFVLDNEKIASFFPSKNIPDKIKIEVYKAFHSYAIENVYTTDRFTQIKTVVQNVVETLIRERVLNLLELNYLDAPLFSHSFNVFIISVLIESYLYNEKEFLYNLGLSAVLHDIGKIFIDKKILNKPDQLTREEFKEIQKHPLLGYEYIRKHGIGEEICRGILEHHERYNGSGYPFGKRGEEINIYAQIIAVADVYDALISNRVYRKALPPNEVYEYILSQNNILFSPRVVRTFTKTIYPFPVGTIVRLSNNAVGFVSKNNPSLPLRPVVTIIKENDKFLSHPIVVDLSKVLNLTIVNTLNSL